MRETNVDAVGVSEVAPRSFCHILLVTERTDAIWERTQCGRDPRKLECSFPRAAMTNYHRLGDLKHQGSALSQLERLAGKSHLLVGAWAMALVPYCSSTLVSASISTQPSSLGLQFLPGQQAYWMGEGPIQYRMASPIAPAKALSPNKVTV